MNRIALGVLFLVLAGSPARATTYFVSQGGSDSNSCAAAQSTTLSDQRLTIAAALECLSPGDTLYIHGGTYTGLNNVIDSQAVSVPSGTSWSSAVTIAGAPGETVTIVPPFNVPGIRLTTGSPSYLIFEDLVIDMANSGPGADADGIYLFTAHHNRFSRLEIKNNSNNGVHFGNGSPFNEIKNCRIHDNGRSGAYPAPHGVYITASDNLFEGNEVYDNRGYGFHIYNNHGSHADPSRNIIRSNKIHGNGLNGMQAHGIVIAWGSDNVVYDNIVYQNRGGIQLYTYSANTRIFNNIIYGNAAEGIALQFYGSGNVVTANTVYSNGLNIQDYGGQSDAAWIADNLTNF